MLVNKEDFSCHACCVRFPIIDGIPAFSQEENGLGGFFDTRAMQYGDSPLSYVNSQKVWHAMFSRMSFFFCRNVFKRLICLSGQTILDVGCGTGNATDFLLKAQNTIYGLDISGKLLSYAKIKGFRTLCSSVLKPFPFEEAFFDAVLLLGVIPCFDVNALDSVIREIGRVTKKQGKIFVSTPISGGVRKFSKHINMRNRKANPFLSYEDFIRRLSACGRVTSVYSLLFPFPLYFKHTPGFSFPLSSSCLVEMEPICSPL